MTKDELAEIIGREIERNRFARIPMADMTSVFMSPGQQVSFTFLNAIEQFAKEHGWAHQATNLPLSDSFIFYRPEDLDYLNQLADEQNRHEEQ